MNLDKTIEFTWQDFALGLGGSGLFVVALHFLTL